MEAEMTDDRPGSLDVPRRRPRWVLVVAEDREDRASDLTATLRSIGYEISDIVGTSEQALERTESLRPDVVLLHLSVVGEIDLVEAGNRISRSAHIPVVYVGGAGDDAVLERVIREDDPFGYIPEPFDQGNVYRTVEVAIYRRRVENALRAARDREAAIAQLGHRALGTTDIQALMAIVAETAARVLRLQHVGIAELQPDGASLLLRAGVGWREGAVGRERFNVQGTLMGRVVQSGGPAVAEDFGRDVSITHAGSFQEYALVGGAAVPIRGYNRLWGAVAAYTMETRPFTDQDVYFLQSVANLLSAAFERWRADEALKEVSTPILPVREGVLMVPLIGVVDLRRVRHVVDQLLAAVLSARARVVVLDVTGVEDMEVSVANELLRMTEAGRLQGAHVVVSGISARLARTFVRLKLDLAEQVRIVRDLEEGIQEAERIMQGLSS
jgi:anti-anti-sigma regulatory factor/AmiR/NasT family two-component response regulator